MRKYFAAILLVVLCFSMISCSSQTESITLDSRQQALADSFYRNRDLWETRIGEANEQRGKRIYCVDLQLYTYGDHDENVGVRCGYSNYTSIDNIGDIVVIYDPLAFAVSENDVRLVGGTEMIDTAKVSKELWPINSCSYLYDSNEDQKMQRIEGLFSKLK